MDPTAERPQSPEIEKVPLVRIGFLGRGAGFLRVKLEDQMGQDRAFSAYDLKNLKEKIKQLREANQDIPIIVVTDIISPQIAKELNSQEISIIFLKQKPKDYSYLISEDPQGTVRNAVIEAESIDTEHMETLLPKVTEAINNLTQPK